MSALVHTSKKNMSKCTNTCERHPFCRDGRRRENLRFFLLSAQLLPASLAVRRISEGGRNSARRDPVGVGTSNPPHLGRTLTVVPAGGQESKARSADMDWLIWKRRNRKNWSQCRTHRFEFVITVDELLISLGHCGSDQ